MVELYLATMRMAVQEQFQYRTANYFYMLGMIAEPIIYLVVWTTIAEQQGGSVQGLSAGYFVAYYIVWTLVRNMNIVFGAPFWEFRIREGELNRDLLRPVLPLHYDIAYFAGWRSSSSSSGSHSRSHSRCCSTPHSPRTPRRS
jgi:ABC-2 type transport system permease protein